VNVIINPLNFGYLLDMQLCVMLIPARTLIAARQMYLYPDGSMGDGRRRNPPLAPRLTWGMTISRM
jgi:hypothetical protein